MCLIYNGKVLCPHSTLADYYYPYSRLKADRGRGGGNDSLDYKRNDAPITIHASYPIRGGCFMLSFSILIMILMAISMSLCTCGLSLIAIPILGPFLFILPLFCL